METPTALAPEIWAQLPPEARTYIRALEARVAALEAKVEALQGKRTAYRVIPCDVWHCRGQDYTRR